MDKKAVWIQSKFRSSETRVCVIEVPPDCRILLFMQISQKMDTFPQDSFAQEVVRGPLPRNPTTVLIFCCECSGRCGSFARGGRGGVVFHKNNFLGQKILFFKKTCTVCLSRGVTVCAGY